MSSSSSLACVSPSLVLRVLHTAVLREARTHARGAPWGSKLAVWRGQVVAWMRDVRGGRRRTTQRLGGTASLRRLALTAAAPPPPQLAAEFKFDAETVAIAVSFFDRVLGAVPIPSKVFQTAALACMYIGAHSARAPAQRRAAPAPL